MSEIKVEGDIKAGRDNVINVGDQQTYKDIYQMVPDELREEDRHSRKVSWNYRLDRVRKSKIFFLILLVGIIGLVIAGVFVKDLYIDYTGGAKPTVKIVVHFIVNALDSIQDKNDFIIMLLAMTSSAMIFLALPVLAISNLWFKEDRFLAKQRQWRNEIRDRLLHLGEKP
ncbi:MAG: DUF998 domain-containing protein [Candidatus Thiodiazotropha sp.]